MQRLDARRRRGPLDRQREVGGVGGPNGDAHPRGRAELRLRSRHRAVTWTRCPTARRPRTSSDARSSTSSSPRAHGGPVGERDPRRQVGAVHRCGHGAVQELLHRRREGAVPARDLVAEVRPRRRQAQRPRRHRPHEPALLLLRDARQLQLRRLLQGRGDPVGVGVHHRRAPVRSGAAVGHGAPHRRRSRRASGATSSGVAENRIQRLGDETNLWKMADTGPCGYNSEIFLDLTPELGEGGGPAEDEDRYVEFWNLVFMQYDQRDRRHARAAAEAVRRHRRRPRALRRARCRARRRSGTSTASAR